MLSEEMVHRGDQFPRVLLVATGNGRSNVIPYHLANLFQALIALQQFLSQCARNDLRHMLVLRNSQDLGFIEVAEGDAVGE